MRQLPFNEQLAQYRRLFGARALPYALLARWRPGRYVGTARPPLCRRRVRLRLGSSDIRGLEGVFHRKHYAIEFVEPPRVIMDVGANIGLSAIYFARKFKKARVFAIEPEAGNFALLERNVKGYPRITPIRAALWSREEPLNLLGRREESGGFKVSGTGEPAPGWVQGRTLDGLMTEYGIERIDLLKIDIEGAEKEVFKDASAWIGQVEVIIIELHDFLKHGCEWTVRQAVKDFAYYGRRSIYALVARDPAALKRIPPRFKAVAPGERPDKPRWRDRRGANNPRSKGGG